ncbi:fumarylacetoacetate hydrolase family protein [Bradyrhizobium liaoningense]|uniref:fumarylacetoacetate hydrolase family protein n=1 Tax=Bradyrhizobium liaoningense TaxID=43992 RepID=UPI001BA5511B|nr:fumarylacetoacetate hydrolase family protein [Bradyrhizobium liaoningense]MBR0706970.1 fumarylacetoacetate hydrolase family protein [Bradyrhizobium liaoningense]
MKICRFNTDRVGVIDGESIIDVTDALDMSPKWPLPHGDWIVPQLASLTERGADSSRPKYLLSEVRLESPVANPGKIIGAPINYKAHIEEANADREINQGKTHYTSLDEFGLFLKAGSSLIGPSQTIYPRFRDRRTDHEVELAVVVGKSANRISRHEALQYVLGYTIALDVTVRGKEFPSFRKSADTYSVLGPWLVTADEVPDPNALDLSLSVNGQTKQKSNTRMMIFDVARLIEYASSFYTLHPGDVIMTGTPEGVSPISPGDRLVAEIDRIGRLEMRVGETLD